MGMLGTLIPLVIFCGFLGAFGWIGYEVGEGGLLSHCLYANTLSQMYLYSSGLADRGVKHLEKKNIVYTKDGMTVGVKDKSEEQVNDKFQRYVF